MHVFQLHQLNDLILGNQTCFRHFSTLAGFNFILAEFF